METDVNKIFYKSAITYLNDPYKTEDLYFLKRKQYNQILMAIFFYFFFFIKSPHMCSMFK